MRRENSYRINYKYLTCLASNIDMKSKHKEHIRKYYGE